MHPEDLFIPVSKEGIGRAQKGLFRGVCTIQNPPSPPLPPFLPPSPHHHCRPRYYPRHPSLPPSPIHIGRTTLFRNQ